MHKKKIEKIELNRIKSQLEKYYELVSLMDNGAFRTDIHAALEHHFEVLLMATMSAGKSTLLNAILGTDLLPYGNEACTAIVYRLEDQDGTEGFICRAVIGETITEWQPATSELLKGFNETHMCSLVEMKGDMPFVKNIGARLVLYDTPGPNNARDIRHAQILKNVMRNQQYGLVIFLLNGTNINTNDEQALLEELLTLSQEKNKNKDIIFIVNKVDEIDDGNGESLDQVMANVRAYLKGVGFTQPTVIPTMANAAKLFRMAAKGERLTRHQCIELSSQLDLLRHNPYRLLRLSELNADLNNEIERGINGNGHSLLHKPFDHSGSLTVGNQSIRRSELERAVYSTGIHTIESILEKLIYDKALPNTIDRVSTVMRNHGANELLQWISHNNGFGR